MTRSRALLFVPAALAALLVAGCSSGGSSGPRVASGASSTSSSTASPSSTAASPSPSAAPTSENSPLGDIPDNQVFVPYSPAGASFSVKVPEGWARADVTNGVSFTDKLNTVTVQQLAAAAEPTKDTVRGGVLTDLAASGHNVGLGPVETVTLPAGRAVHATYTADSAADPVTGKVTADQVELYVFWRHGSEVLLTLSGPKGADNVDPWRIVSTSFSWR
ncbi:MAG: lipoprotein [Blastococcus sp.]|jgi:hypothetical protein|nr:lipoprotein [Blastococcus sp.]